jgi:hypothetical protein
MAPGLVFKAFRCRDGFTCDFGCGRYENLSGAISWLTFSRAEQLTSGEAGVIGGGTRRIDDLFSLFSPAGRQPRRRALAREDAKGYRGRLLTLLFASDIMHGQLGVLDQTRLSVVSARNDSEQARIGCRPVIGVLD